MVDPHANFQSFAVNTSQGMLQPNTSNTRRYRRNDDTHSMLNDDLNE